MLGIYDSLKNSSISVIYILMVILFPKNCWLKTMQIFWRAILRKNIM